MGKAAVDSRGDLEPLYVLKIASCEIRGAGTTILLYAIILHTLAGVVTGSVFKIRTLTFVLIVVLIEAATLTAVGVQIPVLWMLVNLAAIQVGYIAGVFARRSIEQTGNSVLSVRLRWPQ